MKGLHKTKIKNSIIGAKILFRPEKTFGLLLALFCSCVNILNAQTTETISSGSFVINMGILPQTLGNGLKPYGMIYDLLKNYQTPVKWVIKPSKIKDGEDFNHNGISYKGGTFIIPAEFRTSTVNARITYWQGQGVNGNTTVAPVSVPVYTTLFSAPRWTMDKQNGAIAVDFFNLAGIPSTAYGGSSSSGWDNPSDLDCCDDLFVMPHADPQWSTHGNLYNWNLSCRGGIWLGCHAGSALEDMFNPSAPSQQTNFLAEKTGTASGVGPYSENALILWDNHSDGTVPYVYDYPTEPVMQFMSTLDVATQNGSEQIFIPMSPGWRSTTKIGIYDPDHPQKISTAVQHRPAILAWGRGLGDSNRGLVMLEASHDLAKASAPANVAAIRAFFNFSFLALADKSVIPSLSSIPDTLISGTGYALSANVTAPNNISDYTIQWTSDCGGTFSPSATSANVTFTHPSVSSATSCKITVVTTDACGRQAFDCKVVTVLCNMSISSSTTPLCAGTTNTGAINMTVSGGSAPYTYSWTKSGGGSGSGTGTSITGLAAGTYSVTVTESGGCTKIFSATVSTSPAMSITATTTSLNCSGSNNGSITLSVSGGTPGYTYDWGSGVTTQNRSNLSAGTYTVTVTDARGCTATQSATITSPTALTASSSTTNVLCRGNSTGAINLTVSGGTSPYSYLWNDGITTQNRSNIPAATYSVTITDANSCSVSNTGIAVTQPAAALSVTTSPTNPSCNGSTNGAITATVSGGTSPYTYDWTGSPTGDGTNTITGLSAGTYTVTVTDANGCSETVTTTLSQSAALVLSTTSVNPTCPSGATAPLGSDGSIDLTVSGGTSPYSYSWTTTSGSGLVPTNQDQTGLSEGTYSVLVTDAAGCTANLSIILNNINPSPVQPGTINNN